ncbi:MAG TPA: pyridoxamine 5'-phosphate oxidase family protein [Acidimicrobiia bacterium]|nr:pyridoxamine 5'-phosphate oxidase family protein [Acidimicrobiia bacterium]
MVQRTRLTEIDPDECLRLLREESYVGRLAFVVDGRPLVLPVNYVADGSSVVFVTPSGTKLSALRDGAAVAFEIDQSRALYHTGWSVLVQGLAHEVTDEDEIARLQRGPLRSWAEPKAGHWVRITIDEISGRRVGD